MSNKNEKVTLRDDGEGGGGRSSSDGGVEGGGIDVRLEGDIEDAKLDSGVDASISVDNVSIEHTRLHMENTRLEDGVQTLTDLSSGKLPAVDGERLDTVSDGRLGTIDDTRLSAVDSERLNSVGGDVGGEAQAITITIMDPGSLDPSALDPGTLGGALVTTVEAQSEDATGFMVPVNDDGTIVVQGDEGLHSMNDVSIALINSASDNSVTSLNQVPDRERTSSIIKANNSSLSRRKDVLRKDFVSVSAAEEDDDEEEEEIGRHCFVCNIELPTENEDDSVSVFKTQTTSSLRKVSVILSSLVGQTLTARKAHSDIMCRRCFSLLDRVDTLEVEIKTSKEEIVTKFQNTIALYGGRARKRKPTAAVRRDFVFPKVEPDDDYEAKELDMGDDTFEPTVDDLMQEEADERDDDNLLDVGVTEGDDAEWEPQTKRPRVKKEPVEIADPNAPPKRKRGRPRKGTTPVKAKEMAPPQVLEIKMEHEDELEEDKAWDEENMNEEDEEGSDGAKGRGSIGKRKVQGSKHWTDYEVVLPKRRSRVGVGATKETPVWLDEPLSCSECGLLFNNVALYKVHCTESHLEPRGLQCPYCPLVFDKKHDFDSHQIDHAPLGHVCQKCSIGFPSVALLIKHIQDHHPGKDNSCQRCNATFVDKEQLEHHYQFKHKVGRKKDDAFRSISRNDRGGSASVDILCKECGKVCPSIIAYQSHKYNEHIYLYPFECQVCRRRFIKETYLKNHMKSHVEGNVECPKCLVKFGNGTYLTDHLYYVHGQKKGLMCSYCSKFFTTPTSLKLHTEMEHRDLLDIPCDKVCEVCGDKYPSLHSLKKHMFTHSRDHMCTYCKKKLSSKAALELHVNMIHTKEFSFFCPHCNREFFAKHLLQMHIKRVHSDRSDYAFKCSRCPKAYLQEWELTLHMKTHTNERNYKCDICGEAFYTLSRMRYHRGTHKTTRDSECPMCSQMFRRDVDTKNHLRRVHKVVQPGRFMDMCIRLGRKKAQEHLEELMAVETEQDDEEEKGQEMLLTQQTTQSVGFMGDNHEHITLYSLKDEDQEEPLQVVIPEGMELIVLKDSVGTQSSHNEEQQHQGQVEQGGENETVTYVEPHSLFGIIQGDVGAPELGQDQRPVMMVTRAALPTTTTTTATFTIGAGSVGRTMVEVQTEGEYSRRNLVEEEAENSAMGGNRNRLRIGAVKVQSCQYCGEDVPISNLVSHLDAHERPQYLCPFCSSTQAAPFRAPRLALARHLQELHYDQLICCDACPAKFHSSQAAAVHRLSHVEGKYECIECHIRFSSSDELCNHQLIAHHPHQLQERLVCTPCGKAFNLRSKYLSHVVKMHRGQMDVTGVEWGPRGHLVCAKCKKKFRKVSLFLEHEKHHLTTDYHCHLCYSKYSKESSLVDHLLAHQFGDQECQECCVRFSSVLKLSQHREKVHNVPPGNACELCGKAFRTKVLLICHRRKYHPESEECRSAKFECTECSMKFVVRGNLIRHMKTHTGHGINDNIACAICNKVLSSKYTLATHMRCHSTLKMHKCTVCEKGFRNKYILNDHMRRVHDDTGIGRDKVCHQCGRSFFTKSELNYHLNTHTGFRPFKCPVCEDTYMSSSSLRYHLQKHSDSIFVCQHCPAKFKNYVGWSSHLRRVHQITSVKDYARKQGILGSLIKEEPKMGSQGGHTVELNEPGGDMAEFYIVDSEGMLVTPQYTGDQNTTDLASTANALNTTTTTASGLAMDLDENIIIAPDQVAKIIHIVPYDDLADSNNHMAVHTVEEDEATAMSGETITADIIPSTVVTDDTMAGDVIANSTISGNPIADDVIPTDVIASNIIPDVISDDPLSHADPPPSTVFTATSFASSSVTSSSFASTSPTFVSNVFTSSSVAFPTCVSAFPSSTTTLTTANTSHLEQINQVVSSGTAKNSFPLDSSLILQPSSTTDQMNKGFLEVDVGMEDDGVGVDERSEEMVGKGVENADSGEKEGGGNDEGWFVGYVGRAGEQRKVLTIVLD